MYIKVERDVIHLSKKGTRDSQFSITIRASFQVSKQNTVPLDNVFTCKILRFQWPELKISLLVNRHVLNMPCGLF